MVDLVQDSHSAEREIFEVVELAFDSLRLG